MKFQIRDGNGNIVDSSVGKYYVMELMKEDDQNDCDSL